MARSPSPLMSALPTVAHWLERVSPRLAGDLGWRLWRSHPRHPTKPAEQAVLDIAATGRVRIDGADLKTWTWGDNSRRVLLAHGWGGRAGQMSPFVEPLRLAGYSVIAFDQPGHGQSGGDVQHVAEFTRSTRRMLEILGSVDAVIAHSVGGAAAAMALADTRNAGALVTIGSPASLEDMVRRLTGWLGIGEAAVADLRRRMRARAGQDWPEVHAERYLPQLADIAGLIVHDRDDQEVPFDQARLNLEHWPGARLLETRELGHQRILRDAGVIEDIVAFIQRASAAAGRQLAA